LKVITTGGEKSTNWNKFHGKSAEMCENNQTLELKSCVKSVSKDTNKSKAGLIAEKPAKDQTSISTTPGCWQPAKDTRINPDRHINMC
jgi:hypothetical protein